MLSLLDSFLYASPIAMVEVNVARSKPLFPTRAICQAFALLPLLYALALKLFLCRLRANPGLRYLMPPRPLGTLSTPRTSQSNDSAEIDEGGGEIRTYETITWVKINPNTSIGLWLGSWKVCLLPDPFIWTDRPCKILSVYFCTTSNLKIGWKFWRRS